MNRNWLVLVAMIIVATVSVTGSSGFTSASVERPVQIAIVDDKNAFLGFEKTVTSTNDTTNLTVRIANQFPDETTLETVRIRVDDRTRHLGPLQPGEIKKATFQSVGEVQIHVAASSDNVQLNFTRHV